MKYYFLKAILCITFFVITFAAIGQPRPPDPDGQPVPISGIEWLLVTGGLFGARKIYQKYKKA